LLEGAGKGGERAERREEREKDGDDEGIGG